MTFAKLSGGRDSSAMVVRSLERRYKENGEKNGINGTSKTRC